MNVGDADARGLEEISKGDTRDKDVRCGDVLDEEWSGSEMFVTWVSGCPPLVETRSSW